MIIKGDNRNFATKASQTNITRDNFGHGNNFDTIFKLFNTNVEDNILDAKEIRNAISIFNKIGKKHSIGDNKPKSEQEKANNTIDDSEINDTIKENKIFKNINISVNDLKMFIVKFYELNDKNIKHEFALSNGLTPSKTNPSIAFNNEGKPVLIYDKQNGELGTFSDRLKFDEETGCYEIPYEIVSSEKHPLDRRTITPRGFYDNNNNKISYGFNGTEESYENFVKYAHLLGYKATDQKYIFCKDDEKYIYDPENKNFHKISDTDIQDSSDESCLIHLNYSFKNQYYGHTQHVNKFLGFYNNKIYTSEAQYYIDKNNLNLKEENGTFIDKDNQELIYTHTGRGVFKLTTGAKVTITKKLSPNGQLDQPIYQAGVGDCYLVSALQGIQKYMPQTFRDSGIVQEVDDGFIVRFPGLKNNKYGTQQSYIVSQGEIASDIQAEGNESSLGDPDAIIIENAYADFRADIIQNLLNTPQYKNLNSRGIYRQFNTKIENNNIEEYNISPESIDAYSQTEISGSGNENHILSGGNQYAVLKLLLPSNTEIKIIEPSEEKSASQIIDEYSKNGYIVYAAYTSSYEAHGVAYDNEAGQFISTYDPAHFDNELLTEESRNTKIGYITVVKIPASEQKN